MFAGSEFRKAMFAKSVWKEGGHKMKVSKGIYIKVIAEEASRIFEPLGFVQKGSAAFWRNHNDVVHGFYLTPNASFTHITVEVGADVPVLQSRCDYVAFGGEHYARLLVSRPLGLLRRDPPHETTFYHFATINEMRARLPQIYADFVEEAEPWLAGMTTIEAVAREFHKWRIAPPAGGHKRPPDPFASAIYGWLLQETGKIEESKKWLTERTKNCVTRYSRVKAARSYPQAREERTPSTAHLRKYVSKNYSKRS